MKYMTRILLAVMLATSPVYGQNVFNKYGPVAGIQKSTGTDYHNTAAASTDVVSLWSGTCDASHFLAGNGTCAVPAGTGVTSVALTVPFSWESVSGSPVTSSGTLAINAVSGLTANQFVGTPNGSTGSVSLRSLVGADLPPINLGSTANGGVSSSSILLGTNGGTSNGFFSVSGPATSLKTFTFPNASATVLTTNALVTVAQGGTNLGTLTANGVMLGEGTSNPNFVVMGADTVLRGTASADPVATSVNNCGSATQALSYSTSTHTFGCQSITGTGANPTASVGLTAVNGSATTFLRSDGAPALDQTISPSMSGTWTFTRNTTTTPSVSVGTTGSQGILCVGNSTCNQLATSGDPAHTIELVDNGGSLQGVRLMTFASGAAAASPLHWARADGTAASPTALLAGDNIMSMGARGYDGTSMSGSTIAIEGVTSENWGTNNHGTYLDLQVVPTADASGARKSVFQLRATTSATNPTMITNGTGGTSVGYMPVTDAAGTRFGYWGKASGSNNDISYESDAGLRLTANNGTDPMHIGVTGETKVNFNGVDMTPDTSTYTGTLTGITATVTNTMKLSRQGNIVCIWTDTDFTGTSNTNAMTITGTLPAGFAPASNRVANVGNMQDNGVGNQVNGQATIVAGGTITLAKLASTGLTSSTNWTTSGSKGINAGWTFCYPK